MAEALFLSLWFESFNEGEILDRISCVLRQFPFSASRPGIGYVAVHSVSWSEPVVFQETFDHRVEVDQAIALAQDVLHSDNAYVFEATWDLWAPIPQQGRWSRQAQKVRFIAHGEDFDEGANNESGHVQVDFGLDSHFLHPDVNHDPE